MDVPALALPIAAASSEVGSRGARGAGGVPGAGGGGGRDRRVPGHGPVVVVALFVRVRLLGILRRFFVRRLLRALRSFGGVDRGVPQVRGGEAAVAKVGADALRGARDFGTRRRGVPAKALLARGAEPHSVPRVHEGARRVPVPVPVPEAREDSRHLVLVRRAVPLLETRGLLLRQRGGAPQTRDRPPGTGPRASRVGSLRVRLRGRPGDAARDAARRAPRAALAVPQAERRVVREVEGGGPAALAALAESRAIVGPAERGDAREVAEDVAGDRGDARERARADGGDAHGGSRGRRPASVDVANVRAARRGGVHEELVRFRRSPRGARRRGGGGHRANDRRDARRPRSLARNASDANARVRTLACATRASLYLRGGIRWLSNLSSFSSSKKFRLHLQNSFLAD